MELFEKRNRLGPLPYIFGALLGISLGMLIISGVLFFRSSQSTVTEYQGSEPAASTTGASIDESRQNAIVRATQQVAPAVVSITSYYTRTIRTLRRSPMARNWLEYFMGVPELRERQETSLGSGVVISPNGYILTNEHVVHNADIVKVTMSDGVTVDAEIVGSATEYDLALLKVDGKRLRYARLGDSEDLVVGEWAIAIGSPFGHLLKDVQPTVTVGVISALHRDVRKNRDSDQTVKDMIQTDAAINPGNSGGPLVNSSGEVIGINSFIFSTGGGSLGMGFAIPINRGKWVLDEIEKYGRVRAVWVGIRARQVTPELAVGLDLKDPEGLLIDEIEHESPADKSGLRPGDQIVSVNGRKVVTVYEANRTIFGSKVGDRLNIDVIRRGKKKSVVLELEERPAEI